MITEDYVYSEIAKLLKEKGFDANINTYRDDFIQRGSIVIPLQECLSKDKVKTPTLQMAMKWLYKNYGIYITILQVEASTVTMEQEYFFYRIQKNRKNVGIFTDKFKEPEQAANSAIKYVLENLI